MLIGAHVSPAGGPAKAIERGEERGCEAIQIFNGSPRSWKVTSWRDEQIAQFTRRRRDSPVKALLIHAIYLCNCASEDRTIRSRSLDSLVGSLRAGEALGADGVVIHPGTAKTGDVKAAIARAGATLAEALKRTESCELHLENTAGAGGTLGRSIDELAALLEAAGGGERLRICLDSCHLLASGYDIRTPAGMEDVLSQVRAKLGAGRLASLHLNDSANPLGSNRDRHACLGRGELGEAGCASFLGARGLQRLPCVLETPGEKGQGASGEEVALARRLHERGAGLRKRA